MPLDASVAGESLQVHPFVAHWRQMLFSARERFGGISWAPSSLYLLEPKYQAVMAKCVRINNPSPFKKCAAFAIAFMDDDKHPVYNEFEKHKYKEELKHYPKFSSAILLFEYIRFSLEGAILIKEDGTQDILENPIKVSKHTYIDIIYTLSLLPSDGPATFHLLALLFEQLAYQTNDAAYKDKI
jgi:hypothetical protein